jgi:hypothetical protein
VIDAFLRSIWLECCGDLSEFTIGSQRCASEPDDWGTDPGEKTMSVRAGTAIEPGVDRFQYAYDFGSTTELRLRVTGRAKRSKRRDAVRLLARNFAPTLLCSTCEAPATSVCSFCLWEGLWLACPDHEVPHEDCDEDGWLPVANSPRMGICGYEG